MALSLRQAITANTLSMGQGGPAVNELRDDLILEETRAMAAEVVNQNAILAESSRAMLVEAATNVQVESINSSLASEITRAVSADSVLGQRITDEVEAEVTRATAEEATLATAVVTERTRALAAEASLQSGVDGLNQETNAIIEAGYVMNDAMSVLVSEETARAMTAENAIQTQISADNIHYGFRVCGTTNQNCISGAILVFDNKTRTDYGCHVVPTISAYNTSTYKYTVESNGYYFFGLSLFMDTNLNNNDIRFGIYVNGSAFAFGGKYVGTGETVTLNMPCVIGDVIDCRCYIGPATVSLNPGHSYFYGWKLN